MADGTEKTSDHESEQLVCKLALKHRFVTEEQVRGVLSAGQREQSQGRKVSVGDIMLQQGLISRKQLDFLHATERFLRLRQTESAFSMLALKSKMVAREQLEEAQATQSRIYKETRSFKPLADILMESGVLTVPKKEALLSMVERIKKEPQGEAVRGGRESAGGSGPGCPAPTPSKFSTPPTDKSAKSPSPEVLRLVADEIFYELLVTEDRLKAFLKVKGDVPENLESGAVRRAMASKGIVHGVVDDTCIDIYLKNRDGQSKPLVVAEGEAPVPGKDACIRYLFDSTRKVIPELDEQKNIDLKNRGEIPQVKQGDMVAEKSLLVPEIHGMDVFGKPLKAPAARDVRFMIGTGIELSPDGLKALAKTDGRPELSSFGKLSVLAELLIEGDVGFETGNVSFEGLVTVRGVVQDGFHVKARGLTAREIGKAECDIAGDIVVHGGILGAVIRCRGGIRAVHIHTARIEAQDSVVVEKGIFDSRIQTSGKCVAERGKIISSKIIARMGIEANTIGSEISEASTLLVGIDPVTEKHLEELKASIAALEKDKGKHRERIAGIEEQNRESELRIGELAQVQDRGALKNRELQARIAALEKSNDTAEIQKVENTIRELDARIRSAEKELNELFDIQDQFKEGIAQEGEKIQEIDRSIWDIQAQIDSIAEWTRNNPGLPVVKVTQVAFAGTVIRSPFAALTLASNTRSVRIRETQEPEEPEGGRPGKWRLAVQSLY